MLIKDSEIPLSLHRQVIHRGYDGKSCWVHARCVIDRSFPGDQRMLVTLQKSLMGTSEGTWDIFGPLHMMTSEDGGARWSQPAVQPGLAPWVENDGAHQRQVVISDFTGQWHVASGVILGLGHTVRYRDGELLPNPRQRETVWSVLKPGGSQWSKAELLEMPDQELYFCAGAGSIQWVEKPNGDLLVPIYFRPLSERPKPGHGPHAPTRVVVMECGFDGSRLYLKRLGNPLTVEGYRGLGEPSIAQGEGSYWMTLRNGEGAYYATSQDGLHYGAPQRWRFDDGQLLESVDTQAHWAKVGHRLFLVYTRRTGENDHIVRYRAPLFVAEVDQESGVLIRESEQIAIPERGAQLGNFGVTQCADESALICASEWMENAGEWNPEVWSALEARHPGVDLRLHAETPGRSGLCQLSGSDNSIYLVKLEIS